MTDRDGFDEVFRDLSTFAGGTDSSGKLDDSAFGEMRQLEGCAAPLVDDELIVGEDFVTYLLYTPDFDLASFSLVSRDGDIEVTAGASTFRRTLDARVDAEDASAEYRNGVLSVKLRRIVEHDGGA